MQEDTTQNSLEVKIENMAEQIKLLDSRLGHFSEFLTALDENKEHFTEEERNLASSHYSSLESEYKNQRQLLVSKVQLYESKVVELSKTIQIRQGIIERFEQNGAFVDTDGIFNMLAENHAKLQSEYTSALHQLEE